jgi:heme oxygenase
LESALAALRQATGSAQRGLDDAPLWRRLNSREVTLADYRTYLQVQLAILAAWTEAYPAALRRACRCDPAARLDALHLDLAALRDAALDGPAASPMVFDWPAESAAWFGALYVLESLRARGRAVAQHLRQELGLCVGGALRFLDPAQETSVQPAWPSLAHCLERALPPERVPEAVEGALATYAMLNAAFAGRARDASGAIAA